MIKYAITRYGIHRSLCILCFRYDLKQAERVITKAMVKRDMDGHILFGNLVVCQLVRPLNVIPNAHCLGGVAQLIFRIVNRYRTLLGCSIESQSFECSGNLRIESESIRISILDYHVACCCFGRKMRRFKNT